MLISGINRFPKALPTKWNSNCAVVPFSIAICLDMSPDNRKSSVSFKIILNFCKYPALFVIFKTISTTSPKLELLGLSNSTSNDLSSTESNGNSYELTCFSFAEWRREDEGEEERGGGESEEREEMVEEGGRKREVFGGGQMVVERLSNLE